MSDRPRGRLVGTVAELWRYPVKSMRGELLSELPVTPRGGLGDRAWALRDLASGKIASAKRFPRLLEFRAEYARVPTTETERRIVIEAPDGRRFGPEEPDASALVSRILGHPMRFEREAGSHEVTGIDRSTIFAGVPVEEMNTEWSAETLPDHFVLRPGSFFETGPLFVLASATLEHLGRLRGGGEAIDRRRFRPNLYVESAPGTSGFVEDEWLGGAIAVGRRVVLQDLIPTPWCVTCTHAQEELPRDLGVLRSIATYHDACLGVYGEVREAGTVRVGDRLALIR